MATKRLRSNTSSCDRASVCFEPFTTRAGPYIYGHWDYLRFYFKHKKRRRHNSRFDWLNLRIPLMEQEIPQSDESCEPLAREFISDWKCGSYVKGNPTVFKVNPQKEVEFTMGLPLADEDQGRQDHSEENDQARPLSGVEFNQIITDRLQSTHVENRRNSLPPGILEHINVKSVCGQILRFMGDEHFSKTCGRHLRCMGDEISHLYWLKKTVMGSPQPNQQHTLSHNSHSLPDLRSVRSDQQRDARNGN